MRPAFSPGGSLKQGWRRWLQTRQMHDFYRLWVARNWHFFNNFVPLTLLALLSTMDCQATSTDAVIERMTNYMTKSGQGALSQVMEHSSRATHRKGAAQQTRHRFCHASVVQLAVDHRGEVPTGVHASHLLGAAPFVQQGVPRPLPVSRDAATQNQGYALGGK